MKVKIKRLTETAKLPNYAHPGDAGMDLYADEDGLLYDGCPQAVRTGIAIELPEGYEAQIRPRSGLALKRGITVLNSPGTVDAGYRGEVKVILVSHSHKADKHHSIAAGTKIAQMVVKPVEQAEIIEVDELSDSERGTGGFGSTGG